MYRGRNKQPYNCSEQSVCFTSIFKIAVVDFLTTLKSRKKEQTHQCQKSCFRQICQQTKWRWSVKAKPIVAKPQVITNFNSYLIDVVWYGRLCYNCTKLTNDYSRQRSATECGENGNRDVTFWQEMELLRNQLRHAHKSKDDRKQIKTTEKNKNSKIWKGGHLWLCIKFILLFSLALAETHV